MINLCRLGITYTRKAVSHKFKIKSYPCNHRFSTQSTKDGKCFQSFENLLNSRRNEAKRSIVVQVSSENSFPELYNYCLKFGEITLAHHYQIPHEDQHYILIEFENESIAAEAINSSSYNDDLSGTPVRSAFLWFKASSERRSSQVNRTNTKNILRTIDGIRNITEIDLNDLLQSAQTMDDQISVLHRATCLSDVGTRLRFLSARQVETAIHGMFPFANAQPFGSSVNGFGKMGCDLDLILRFDEEKTEKYKSRLVFHTKENLTNGRSQTQRQMESIGDLLHLFLPGVCHVRRILQARVPIIKFHHEHLNLEVDLSMNNLSGVYMSELLYLFGEIDSRVRPLVFCLRKWAQTVGLTNPSPGRWITNFPLTCLVIFFLQQNKNPVLPPISLLYKSASKTDIRITEDGINCTFLRDLNNLNFQTKNTQNLSELLLQFFEYYSQFDFNNRAISLNESRSILKPDHSAMYIVNPLEQVLNVSKNVSLEECERFRIEVRNAAWILESEIERDKNTNSEAMQEPWGLLNLFKSPERATIHPNYFFKPRMVEVTELFSDKYDSDVNDIDFKDKIVKKQVINIKTKRKTDLKQIKGNIRAVENQSRPPR